MGAWNSGDRMAMGLTAGGGMEYGDRLHGSVGRKFKTRQNYVPLTEVRRVVAFVGGKD